MKVVVLATAVAGGFASAVSAASSSSSGGIASKRVRAQQLAEQLRPDSRPVFSASWKNVRDAFRGDPEKTSFVQDGAGSATTIDYPITGETASVEWGSITRTLMYLGCFCDHGQNRALPNGNALPLPTPTSTSDNLAEGWKRCVDNSARTYFGIQCGTAVFCGDGGVATELEWYKIPGENAFNTTSGPGNQPNIPQNPNYANPPPPAEAIPDGVGKVDDSECFFELPGGAKHGWANGGGSGHRNSVYLEVGPSACPGEYTKIEASNDDNSLGENYYYGPVPEVGVQPKDNVGRVLGYSPYAVHEHGNQHARGTTEECAAECDNDSGCLAFASNAGTGFWKPNKCFLYKDTVPKPYSRPGNYITCRKPIPSTGETAVVDGRTVVFLGCFCDAPQRALPELEHYGDANIDLLSAVFSHCVEANDYTYFGVQLLHATCGNGEGAFTTTAGLTQQTGDGVGKVADSVCDSDLTGGAAYGWASGGGDHNRNSVYLEVGPSECPGQWTKLEASNSDNPIGANYYYGPIPEVGVEPKNNLGDSLGYSPYDVLQDIQTTADCSTKCEEDTECLAFASNAGTRGTNKCFLYRDTVPTPYSRPGNYITCRKLDYPITGETASVTWDNGSSSITRTLMYLGCFCDHGQNRALPNGNALPPVSSTSDNLAEGWKRCVDNSERTYFGIQCGTSVFCGDDGVATELEWYKKPGENAFNTTSGPGNEPNIPQNPNYNADSPPPAEAIPEGVGKVDDSECFFELPGGAKYGWVNGGGSGHRNSVYMEVGPSACPGEYTKIEASNDDNSLGENYYYGPVPEVGVQPKDNLGRALGYSPYAVREHGDKWNARGTTEECAAECDSDSGCLAFASNAGTGFWKPNKCFLYKDSVPKPYSRPGNYITCCKHCSVVPKTEKLAAFVRDATAYLMDAGANAIEHEAELASTIDEIQAKAIDALAESLQ